MTKIIYLLGAIIWFILFGAMFFGFEPNKILISIAFFLAGMGSLLLFLEEFE